MADSDRGYRNVCDKDEHYRKQDCPECFLEQLSEHITFRNGTMILKNTKKE